MLDTQINAPNAPATGVWVDDGHTVSAEAVPCQMDAMGLITVWRLDCPHTDDDAACSHVNADGERVDCLVRAVVCEIDAHGPDDAFHYDDWPHDPEQPILLRRRMPIEWCIGPWRFEEENPPGDTVWLRFRAP